MANPFDVYSDDELKAIADGKSPVGDKPVDFSAYSDDELRAIASQPKPAGNPVSELLQGLYEGVTRRIPEQVGQTMQYMGISPESGKALAEWAREGEEKTDQPGAFRQAGQMIPASAGIPMLMGAAGKAISMIPHPLATVIGTGLQLLPLAVTPFMFGASQAQQTLDSAAERQTALEGQIKTTTDPTEKAGLQKELDRVKENAKPAARWTGIIEAAGESLGTLAFERALGPFAPAVPILKQTGKNVLKGTLGGWLRELAFVTMPTEIGTEIGQQWGEAKVEKEMGIRPEAEPGKEALSVIAPTAIMTALMGGAGKAYSNYHAKQFMGALTNPDEDPTKRMGAAQEMSRIIRENDKDAAVADAWDAYAQSRIARGLDIPVDTPMDALGLQIVKAAEDVKQNLGATDEMTGEDPQTRAAVEQTVAAQKAADEAEEAARLKTTRTKIIK